MEESEIINNMENEPDVNKLNSFYFEGKKQTVSFVETMDVVEGVQCDVYRFDSDETKDLGIIRMQPGCKTPLQKVLLGERTIEGYIEGKGKLTVTSKEGKPTVYIVNNELKSPVVITVGIGELMQWEADPDSSLEAYEICFPPYQDGRYENTP